MEVVISAIFLIYFARNSLNYLFFYERLSRFVQVEKESIIPNLSFNLNVIYIGLRYVKKVLVFKLFMFILFVILFLNSIFQFNWLMERELLSYFIFIFSSFIAISLGIIIDEIFFKKNLLYKGNRVKISGWNQLKIISKKEELCFYLYEDELAMTGKFELESNEDKNEYWKNLSDED